ncbi:MAG: hypothetical protein KDM64_12715 [Verrucomicrobiae bacterium]|nr:hypothetical protein [Verrucomicrobiae bacterium]
MSRFRSLIALFTAIMIASPLCCCAKPAAVQTGKAPQSCCEKKAADPHRQAPANEPCSNCQLKNPREWEAWKALKIPGLSFTVAALPVEVSIPVAAISDEFPVVHPVVDSIRPCRERLSLWQRFLI